jgi:uncharacterized membrane protein
MSENNNNQTWHDKHIQSYSFAQKTADKIAQVMGSWTFIIIQTILVGGWIVLNLVAFVYRWDPYPFILLNLLFSTQAAYAAPIIMMSQNRQNERDRVQALEDYKTNINAKKEIEEIQKTLSKLETDKLDKILEIIKSR